MKNTPLKSIQEEVLEKIRAGNVRRRPRAYFVVRVIATILVGALVLIASAFLISFILFSLHESGEQFLLGFGLRGIQTFLLLFPWALFFISVALIFLLQWLLQGFKFAYRVPLLNIFLIICGITVVLGIGIAQTPIHSSLQGAADRDQLPIFGNIYKQTHDTHEDQGVYRGVVTEIQDHSFTIVNNDGDRDHDDGTFTILIPVGSALPFPAIGSHVLVLGSSELGVIEARNIQILSPGKDPAAQ
jgi:hypothetical protein